MRSRRSPYTRTNFPPRIKLTERDSAILETLYAFDGVLSLKQIDRLFFSGAGRTQPRTRMRMLYDNQLVAMPSVVEQHQVPFGETVYWLARKGAEHVAARQGVLLSELKYLKRPRWSQLSHDLAVNDVRVAIMKATSQNQSLLLDHWIREGEFLSSPDTVRYQMSLTRFVKRQVRPDGFFSVTQVLPSGTPKQYAFLLEVDLATHSTRRFAREKVKAGVSYLKSSAFVERCGARYGRWLVVTTSEQRLAHLKHQTELAGGSKLYLFTTFKQLFSSQVFHAPIWIAAGEASLRHLIE